MWLAKFLVTMLGFNHCTLTMTTMTTAETMTTTAATAGQFKYRDHFTSIILETNQPNRFGVLVGCSVAKPK